MGSDFGDVPENFVEDFLGRLFGIDDVDEFAAVEFEDGGGLAFVGFKPLADDGELGVVEAIFAKGAALEALNHLVDVIAAEVEDGEDIEAVLENAGLVEVAGDAVEDEDVAIGMELAGAGGVIDGLAPEGDGGFIRDEQAAAGVFDELAAEGIFDAEVAEDIAAGAVEETGDGAQDPALGAFAGAGSAEQKNGAIFHAVVPSGSSWGAPRVAPGSSVFVFQGYFLDFVEIDADFLGGVAFADGDEEIGGGDAADALGDIIAAGGLDNEEHLLVLVRSHDREVTGHLSFEEAPVEGVLATGKNAGGGQIGGGGGDGLGGRMARGAAGMGGGSGLIGGDGGFEAGIRTGDGFLGSVHDPGGHGEKHNGGQDGQDCGEAADDRRRPGTEDGNFQGGVEITEIEKQEHQEAERGTGQRREEWLGGGVFKAWRGIGGADVGLVNLLGDGGILERLDEGENAGFGLVDGGESLEVLLGEHAPGNGFGHVGAILQFEADAGLGSIKGLALDGLAAAGMEGDGVRGKERRGSNETQCQSDKKAVKLMHTGIFPHSRVAGNCRKMPVKAQVGDVPASVGGGNAGRQAKGLTIELPRRPGAFIFYPMILEVVKYGHPVLRQKGEQIKSVTPEIGELIDNMFETMYAARGVGLAAQQIGQALQLTVIDVREISQERPSTLELKGQTADPAVLMPMVLINPEVTPVGAPVAGPEGCLSFPEIYADISRPESVDVVAMGRNGERLEFRCGGLLARAVQHETDHLNGILFIDRMSKKMKEELRPELDELQAKTKAELEAGDKTSKG